MEFEWDEAKRLRNIAKHNLDFVSAVVVFDQPIVEASGCEVDGEVRWLVTGRLEGRYVTIVCTYRNDLCRVISFRRARREEKRRHQALHGG